MASTLIVLPVASGLPDGLETVDDAYANQVLSTAALGPLWVVTKKTDSNDHVCSATDCSLREAAEAAAATPASDTISLKAGTYAVTLGPIALGSAVLNGAGAKSTVVDGQNLSGIFTMLDSEVGVLNVTIQRANGPAIYQDTGTLTIANSVLTKNKNLSDCGGAIASVVDGQKDLRIVNSRINKNEARDGGGLCLATVGPIISHTVIEDNEATERGGGIYANEAGVNMTDSTVSKNRAGNRGGGLYSRLGVSGIDSSAFIGNRALDGGGVWSNESGITFTNSTLGDNRARNNGGAADTEDGTILTLIHSTVADNVADSDDDGTGDGGGLFNGPSPFAVTRLQRTIVADNVDRGGQAPDCGGPVTAQAYNLVENVAGCTLSGLAATDLTGVDPQLGSLGLHDGLTRNHLPAAASAAVDAIPVAACTLPLDQRDVTRPRDGNNDGTLACDRGAVERKEAGG